MDVPICVGIKKCHFFVLVAMPRLDRGIHSVNRFGYVDPTSKSKGDVGTEINFAGGGQAPLTPAQQAGLPLPPIRGSTP